LTAADLSRSRLYGILDLAYVKPPDVARVAGEMIEGGVELIQLRAKKYPPEGIARIAAELRSMTQDRGIPLIINDHPEIARATKADGIHVGQDDQSITEVRSVVGPGCVVGKSTHSLDQAIRAFYEGADYIGFGPIFATPTKPDYQPVGLKQIQKVHEAVRLPVFCIGGIKLDNLPEVLAAGARRVVIVSGLLQAENVVAYARTAKGLLNRNSKIENQKS
jgi:thiamine-phosphate pyrophosphorylase